ncbi:MAG: hypothetical protein QM788_00590 [Roseateles sp.]|uniref:hypothetical protein n=1 Tax=Roseateles sp. TaxID=1971397 RepID=UPI0039E7745B
MRFWLGLLGWPLLAAAAALAVCLCLPLSYTAAAMVAVLPAGGAWDGRAAAPPPLAQYGALLQSRRVADRVIAAFQLQAGYGEATLDGTRERLGRAMQFGSTRGGQLLIQASDPLPWRAADLANRHAIELQQLLDELRVEAAQARAGRLRAEVARLVQRLARADTALQAARLDAGQLRLEPRLVGGSHYGLQQALRAAELRLAALRTRLQDGSAELMREQALADALRAQLRRLEAGGAAGSGAPGAGPSYAEAAREVRLLAPWLQQLRMQAAQAEADAGVRSELLVGIDPATVPQRPSGPFVLGYMAAAWLATLLGLLYRAWRRRRQRCVR